MKKIVKVSVLSSTMMLMLNNIVYAETADATTSGNSTMKYVFMGIALLVVILLLFLGYRMDTRDDSSFKPSKSSNKAPKPAKTKVKKEKVVKPKVQEVYEPDNITYENDNNFDTSDLYENDSNFDTSDLVETSEYEEDDDENLFFGGSVPKTSPSSDDIYSSNTPKVEEIPEENETYGEVFDTSIIDQIDDDEEENINVIPKEEDDDIKFDKTNAFDETMVFSNSTNGFDLTDDLEDIEDDETFSATKLEDDNDIIDSTNSLESNYDNSFNLLEEKDNDESFIDSLKKYEEPESSFEGFSVAPDEEIKITEEKKPKKYKKSKKNITVENEIPEEPVQTTDETHVDFDFLAQMEENLEKEKEERESKKTTKKRKTE